MTLVIEKYSESEEEEEEEENSIKENEDKELHQYDKKYHHYNNKYQHNIINKNYNNNNNQLYHKKNFYNNKNNFNQNKRENFSFVSKSSNYVTSPINYQDFYTTFRPLQLDEEFNEMVEVLPQELNSNELHIVLDCANIGWGAHYGKFSISCLLSAYSFFQNWQDMYDQAYEKLLHEYEQREKDREMNREKENAGESLERDHPINLNTTTNSTSTSSPPIRYKICIHGFLPASYMHRKPKEGSKGENELMETEEWDELNRLLHAKKLSLVPPMDDDDSYCISYAKHVGGFLVSNDFYSDHIAKIRQMNKKLNNNEKESKDTTDPETVSTLTSNNNYKFKQEVSLLLWLKENRVSYSFQDSKFILNPLSSLAFAHKKILLQYEYFFSSNDSTTFSVSNILNLGKQFIPSYSIKSFSIEKKTVQYIEHINNSISFAYELNRKDDLKNLLLLRANLLFQYGYLMEGLNDSLFILYYIDSESPEAINNIKNYYSDNTEVKNPQAVSEILNFLLNQHKNNPFYQQPQLQTQSQVQNQAQLQTHHQHQIPQQQPTQQQHNTIPQFDQTYLHHQQLLTQSQQAQLQQLQQQHILQQQQLDPQVTSLHQLQQHQQQQYEQMIQYHIQQQQQLQQQHKQWQQEQLAQLQTQSDYPNHPHQLNHPSPTNKQGQGHNQFHGQPSPNSHHQLSPNSHHQPSHHQFSHSPNQQAQYQNQHLHHKNQLNYPQNHQYLQNQHHQHQQHHQHHLQNQQHHQHNLTNQSQFSQSSNPNSPTTSASNPQYSFPNQQSYTQNTNNLSQK